MNTAKALTLTATAIAAGLLLAVAIQAAYELRNAFAEWTDATT